MTRRAAIARIASTLFAPACDQPEPTPAPAENAVAPADSTATYSDTLLLGDLPVVLEETRLDDVRARFGGVQRDSGQTSTHWYWLCYALADSGVVEVGSSVMGGPEHYITGFSVSLEAPDEACTTVGLRLADVQLQNELKLGIDAARLESRFGVGAQSGDTVRFQSERDAGNDFVTFRALDIVLRQGRVHEIHSARVTAN